ALGRVGGNASLPAVEARIGAEVAVVDDLSSGSRDNLEEATGTGRLRLHELDIREPALTALAAELRPAVVCHLAAPISVRKSVADPVLDAHTNVVGTAAVLNAAREGGARKVEIGRAHV